MMNLFLYTLLALVAVIVVALSAMVGFAAGRVSVKSEVMDAYAVGPPGPQGPEGPPGQTGAMGLTGEPGPPGIIHYDEEIDRHLGSLEKRVNEVELRMNGFNDRFRRVEKKSGLNV